MVCDVGWQLSADADKAGLGWVALASGQLETLTLIVPVDLRGTIAPQLSFQSILASNSVAEVQISLDGMTWATPSLIAPTPEWATVSVDLTGYREQTVFVHFVWQAPLPAEGQTADSWKVDEVIIDDLLPIATPTSSATTTAMPTLTATLLATEEPMTTYTPTLIPTPTLQPTESVVVVETPTSAPSPEVTVEPAS